MININNLIKFYKEKKVLNDISLNVNEGDFFSLLGKNGAGKSTLINILCSLANKTSGKIYIKNYDLDKDQIKIKLLIGMMPQEYNFSQFDTILDIILNQAGFYGISRKQAYSNAKFLLKTFDLWDKKDEISFKLSGGMKRRLMLIRSLIHDPQILFLDEPTNGVDVISRKIIWDFLIKINKNGKTIFLTTHYFEEIETLCNEIAIIENGKILVRNNVKNILNKIEKEIYLIKSQNIEDLLKLSNNEFQFIQKNFNTVELTFNKNNNLRNILKLIIDKNIDITKITNEKNKLEEIFINIINKND